MKILLFAGAGTSIELGVPGMTGLARGFLSHAKRSNVEPHVVEKLMGDSRDLEELIDPHSDDADHQFRHADHRFRRIPITLEESGGP